MNCRICNNRLSHEFVDFGAAPLSNAFLTKKQLNEPEYFFPLKLYVCENCWLVQIDEYQCAKKIFDNDYVYFSSYSKSWLKHARDYANMISEGLKLDSHSQVVEIGANDGYLLQYFNKKKIPCYGVEPTHSTAIAARHKGVKIVEQFFGLELAQQLAEQMGKADLIIGNNVLAHVPDINDFVAGLAFLLKDSGVITLEFPHLMELIDNIQFDTIYHEHFSYFSLFTVQHLFASHELIIYRVDRISTHGGSLRIYARLGITRPIVQTNIYQVLDEEKKKRMQYLDYYQNFQSKVNQLKNEFLEFLIQKKQQDKKVAAYGAAAKGNTLINYCGIRKDLIQFVADASPHKQGMYLPGSHIPVNNPDRLKVEKPDIVVIIPWNIKDELIEDISFMREWKGKYMTVIPKINIF